MTIKEFFSFRQNKYFWANIIAMVVAIIAVLFGVLKGLDIYTHHGQAVVVPNVKGMGVAEAEKMFRNRGLNCVVSDSNYVKTMPAGCILDYNPAAGQKVKEGRIIYLTINSLSIPLQSVPDVAEQQLAATGGGTLAGCGLQAGRDTVCARREGLGIWREVQRPPTDNRRESSCRCRLDADGGRRRRTSARSGLAGDRVDRSRRQVGYRRILVLTKSDNP